MYLTNVLTKKEISYSKSIVTAILILISSIIYAQELKTTFIKDYSRWKLNGESYNTVFVNGFDQWRYKSLDIKTVFRGDNNEWRIGNNVKLRTRFRNSFDKWEISGDGYTIQIETTFHGDYTRWRITGDIEGEMRTVFMNDYERWSLDFDMKILPDDIVAAIAFIPIFTSVHYKN